MLDNKLIENALALCDKEIEDIVESKNIDYFDESLKHEFSIEKFYYYLLSPEFIEKYQENCINDFELYTDIVLSELFWRALYLYQLWQKHHLIDLLLKIKPI